MKMYDWVEVQLHEFFKWALNGDGLFHASTDLSS